LVAMTSAGSGWYDPSKVPLRAAETGEGAIAVLGKQVRFAHAGVMNPSAATRRARWQLMRHE